MGLPRGSTPSGPGVATRSTGHSGSTLATLHGLLRRLLARPGSSMSSTMLATTSLSGPKPLSRMPSLSLTLPPSVSGTSPTMLNLSPERREPLTDAEEAVLNRKMSKKTTRKYAERQKTAEVEKGLLDQFQTGRVLAAISSRPGQCGRSDGYILEGKELEFYLRKIKSKKGK